VAVSAHEDFRPPSQSAGRSFYAKTDSAAWLYDVDGNSWDPDLDPGWAYFCTAYPCDSLGALTGEPLVNIRLPYPVAGTGIPGVRLLPYSTVIEYIASDQKETVGGETMHGHILYPPLGNHLPWCADSCISSRIMLWGDTFSFAYDTGWHICDGSTNIGKDGTRSVPDFQNLFLKLGAAGGTGGAATHTHTTHPTAFGQFGTGASFYALSDTPSHNAVSNEPPYRTAQILMWVGVTGF